MLPSAFEGAGRVAISATLRPLRRLIWRVRVRASRPPIQKSSRLIPKCRWHHRAMDSTSRRTHQCNTSNCIGYAQQTRVAFSTPRASPFRWPWASFLAQYQAPRSWTERVLS